MNPTGRILIPVLVLATAVALLLAPPRSKGVDPGGPGLFADLARKLKPTVVNLQVTRPAPPLPPGHPSLAPAPDDEAPEGDDPRREDDGEGSGLILDPKGLILTNHHVVAGAQTIDVFLADHSRLPGRLVGSDSSTDLALVQVQPLRPLAAARLGSSASLEVGDWVMAIGNPYGLDATVTVGVLSGTGRVIGAGPYDDFLQTDASINYGNSGGPLFNVRGEVVGINTAIIPYGQGIGFAIPIDLAREVVAQLQASGRVIRGFIGLGIQDLSPRLREALQVPGSYQGALVSHVMPGGPAARAGARVQDLVVSWNGRPVSSHRSLMRAVAASPVGRPATLRVYREGRTLDLQVRVERRPSDELAPAPAPPSTPPAAEGRLGLDLAPLDAETARELGTSDLAGLVIEEIRSGSPAAHSDLVPGDILRRVNQTPVATVQEFTRALEAARGETVALLVEREGGTVFVAVVR